MGRETDRKQDQGSEIRRRRRIRLRPIQACPTATRNTATGQCSILPTAEWRVGEMEPNRRRICKDHADTSSAYYSRLLDRCNQHCHSRQESNANQHIDRPNSIPSILWKQAKHRLLASVWLHRLLPYSQGQTREARSDSTAMP